jgi:hypothetical protein
VAAFCREQSLGGDGSSTSVELANVRRATRFERIRRLCRKEKPWRENLMSATGMK